MYGAICEYLASDTFLSCWLCTPAQIKLNNYCELTFVLIWVFAFIFGWVVLDCQELGGLWIKNVFFRGRACLWHWKSAIVLFWIHGFQSHTDSKCHHPNGCMAYCTWQLRNRKMVKSKKCLLALSEQRTSHFVPAVWSRCLPVDG